MTGVLGLRLEIAERILGDPAYLAPFFLLSSTRAHLT